VFPLLYQFNGTASEDVSSKRLVLTLLSKVICGVNDNILLALANEPKALVETVGC
jgi:hypothetical protein